jgi:hypothetical protein
LVRLHPYQGVELYESGLLTIVACKLPHERPMMNAIGLKVLILLSTVSLLSCHSIRKGSHAISGLKDSIGSYP